jgi:hypothetical protein
VQIPGPPDGGLPNVPQPTGSWDSTPHLNESPPADFNVYEDDEPLALRLGLRTGMADMGAMHDSCT